MFHHKKMAMDYHSNKSCVDACLNCAAICNHCAASCLMEENVSQMVRCIQLDQECAALCYAAAELISLGSSRAKELCLICAGICGLCAEECARHEHEHCRECAKACQECAEECRKMSA